MKVAQRHVVDPERFHLGLRERIGVLLILRHGSTLQRAVRHDHMHGRRNAPLELQSLLPRRFGAEAGGAGIGLDQQFSFRQLNDLRLSREPHV